MKSVSRAMTMLALVLAAINLRPGITSLAPLIERIAGDLHLSRGLISLATALPVLCMGLLAPLAPRLAVRFGLERTIGLCLGLIAFALMARLAGHGDGVLIATAVLLGTGIAIAGPLLSGFIKRHFLEQAGRVVGWYSFSMSIGGASGAVFSAPLTRAFGDDWALGLAFWAVPALLAMALWLRLPVHREAAGGAPSGGLPWGNPRAWLVTGFFAIQAGQFYTLATWLVARYHEAGLSGLRSTALFSTFMLVGLPSAFLLPWLAQRFDCRHHLLLVCGMTATLCLGTVALAPTFYPEVCMVLLGFALSGSFSLSLVLPLYEVHSPMEVSRWTAMMLCAGYCLGCLMPVLIGLGRDLSGGYRLPFLVMTGLALGMCALAIALRPRRVATGE